MNVEFNIRFLKNPSELCHNSYIFPLAITTGSGQHTHIHAFWVAALLLALVKIPDLSFPSFSKPLDSIAGSLETMAAGQAPPGDRRPAQVPNSKKVGRNDTPKRA